jgi:mannose-6-phosphate isomerase-like protein (cupin superfamily)
MESLMKKRIASAVILSALLYGAAQAQSLKPGEPQYLSNDDITKLLKADPSGMYSQVILSREGGLVMITTRDKSGEGESHAGWNDFIIVQEGEAHFTLGGTLTGAREVGPGEVRSSGVIGGRTVTLRSGDYIFAPAGTAHRMEVPAGGKVRYIVFKTRK